MERLSRGDIAEGTVCDIGMNGEGIVKLDAYPVFVPFALKGETIRFRIAYAKKDYAFGDLIEVLSPSNERVKPLCPYFTRCGGCDVQHLSSQAQSEFKLEKLKRALLKIGGISTALNPVIKFDEWGYRNKLSLPFGRVGKDGRAVLGFYEKKSHRVVPIKWCPLHGEWVSELIAAVTEWANENGLSVYDEKTGKGLLRHLVARMITTLSVTLVINGDSLPDAYALYKTLSARFNDVALYVSVNKSDTNVILGEEVRLLYGAELPQRLGIFCAKVSPKSFLQVNDKARDALYDCVCEGLGDFDGDIAELYSGVGLLTAQLALRLPDVRITAVEIVPEAVKDADGLMQALSLENRVKNVCADAHSFIDSLAEERSSSQDNSASDTISDIRLYDSRFYLGAFDFPGEEKSPFNENFKKCKALILDPPRKGCAPEILQAALRAGFERIIYISCNPATLSRDLKILLSPTAETVYEIKTVQPFDFFPQTSHIETLVCLTKSKN